jgi:hypothetical protein
VATGFSHSLDSSDPPRSGNEDARNIVPNDCELDRVPSEGAAPGSEGAPRPRVLFLDDDASRAELFLVRYPGAVWVQTAEQCIERLSDEWDEVHLDHDLGGERFVDPSRSDCGMEVVRWLCAKFQERLHDAQFIIHSHNVQAAEMMVWTLYAAGYRAAYRPFAIDLVDWLSSEEPGALGRPGRGLRRWFACPEWLKRLSHKLRTHVRF